MAIDNWRKMHAESYTRLGTVPQQVIKSISIGNSMVSSAIWKKHARVSFSKTIEIAQVRRTSAIRSL